MQRDFIKVIKGTAEEILPKDSKVILFGSRARNDAREDSDWEYVFKSAFISCPFSHTLRFYLVQLTL